ncbi:MAG TPA: ATP-grasp domain-containing protein [Bacteroidia bacterium]|jgi:carbamoyl-phosphate synthase large subunit|nr:ATP-grasp domain-containing protein [Bacteroidia bacterium]
MKNVPAIHILITSTGATGAQNVIKALRRQQQFPVRIIGADADPMNAGRFLVDAFHVIPSGSDPDYVPALLTLCKTEHIHIFIPIMEKELEKISGSLEAFRPYFPVVSAPDTILNCNDKRKTASILDASITPSPRMFNTGEELRYPVIIKPASGTGSTNITVCRTEAEYKAAGVKPDYLVQEFIEGKEYTVDAYTSFYSDFSECVPRIRLAVKGGLAVKTCTVEHPRLIETSKKIIQALHIKGPSNLQFIEKSNGELYFIEINPRFGGAYIASIQAGLNAPLFILNDFTHTPIAYTGYSRNLLMMRYWEEVYEQHLV